MNEAHLSPVKTLAAHAGIRIPDEREPALAAGLEVGRRIAETLAGLEYGEHGPAASFRPPQESSGR